MKLFSVQYESQRRIAVEFAPGKVGLLPTGESGPRSMLHLIAAWEQHSPKIKQLISAAESGLVERLECLSLDQLKVLPPISRPEKVICVGQNYADHAKEMGGDVPDLPVIFSKFSSSIIGPGDFVVLPEIANQVDYEAELVVVIGKKGRHIEQKSALDYVFGYTCGNDVSSRDWQKGRPGGQWLLGKTFDTFAPIGPAIVTTDQIQDPSRLNISLTLNGNVMQSDSTANLIFPIDRLISHISQFVTLEPGDLIFTGTPSGVGAGRSPQVFLQPGDKMTVGIDGIGSLTNEVAGLNPV